MTDRHKSSKKIEREKKGEEKSKAMIYPVLDRYSWRSLSICYTYRLEKWKSHNVKKINNL